MKKPQIPKNEKERLKNLHCYDILDTVQEEAFDDLTELAASICEAPIALISLIDENRQWFKSRVGLSETETSRDISFCGHAINQTDLFIVQDATKDERFSDNPLVTQDPSIRFYAGTPLISPEGHALGTLCVIDRKSRKMKIEHQNALRILSRHVMTQMEIRKKTAELKSMQAERDSVVEQLEKERTQIEALVNERTKKLQKAEEKSQKLLKQTEHSRRALLSILEDQKRTEQTLRESEEKFRSLVKNDPNIVFIINRKGDILYMNHAPEGMDLNDVILKNMYAFMKPDFHESVKTHVQDVFKTGKSLQYETAGIGPGGGESNYLSNMGAIFDSEGNVVSAIISTQDITERKRSEELLKESEKNLVEAQKLGKMGSWIWDIQRGNVEWSDEVYCIFELERESFRPKIDSVMSRFHPEDRKVHEELITQAIADHKPYNFESRILLPDGSIKFLNSSSEGKYDDKGNLTSLSGTVQDITERKQAEEELLKSEIHYRALFEHSPVPLWEEDFSEVKKFIDTLKKRRIKNFRKYFNDNPEAVNKCVQMVKIININNHVLELHKAESKIELLEGLPKIFTDESVIGFKEELIAIAENRTECKFDAKIKTLNGKEKYIHLRWTVVPGYEESLKRIYISTIDITDRKNAEESLKESEERYRKLIETSPDGIAVTNLDGKISFVNQKAVDLHGFDSAEELIGKSSVKFVAPEDRPLLLKHAKDALESHRAYNFEHTLLRRDGSCFPAEANATTMFGLDGKPVAFLTIFRDITVRKQAEEMQNRQRLLIEQILQTAQEGYILADTEGAIKDVNPAYCEMIGYSKEELLKMNIRKLEVQLSPEEINRRIKQMVKKSKDRFESKHKRKDGIVIDLDVSIVITTSDEIQLVAAFVSDITERKWAEEKLQKNFQEITALNKITLEMSKSLSMRQVVKTILDGAGKTIKPDLTLIFVRDEDRLILQNYKPKNSKYSHDKTPEHKVGECMCGLAISGKKPLYSLDIRKDSRCTWNECKKAGLRSFVALPLQIGDKPIGVLGVASAKIRDFRKESIFLETLSNEVAIGLQNAMLYEKVQSHAVELEHTVSERTKELRKAVMRLQELDKLKSIFLASMSHELRTPLNSIIGFTGILLMGMAGELNEEQKKQLEKVKNSASHLLNLINDILDISKIEAGKVEVYIEKINLKEIIKEVVDTISPHAKERNLEIKHTTPKNIVLESDIIRLKQILMNLVSNAVKYTDKGNVNIKVSVLKNKTIKVKVVDTGIGIAKKNLEKLFQPFQQVDASLTNKRGGTGLGLYLCEKLITLLGGSISVKSEYRKGSEFTFILPKKFNKNSK